jgi:hypothetical protein
MSKIAQSLSERLRARQEPRLESDRIRPRLPLKPETIFLVRGDTGELPKVVDFGLAKFLSTSQETIDTNPGQTTHHAQGIRFATFEVDPGSKATTSKRESYERTG